MVDFKVTLVIMGIWAVVAMKAGSADVFVMTWLVFMCDPTLQRKRLGTSPGSHGR